MNFSIGNFVLILIGIGLTASGPYICYRTVTGVMNRRKEDPTASMQLGSNFINILIGVTFFMCGILFVVNNLRGNPLPQ